MEYQTMDKDYDNVEDEHDDDDDKKINNVVRSQIGFCVACIGMDASEGRGFDLFWKMSVLFASLGRLFYSSIQQCVMYLQPRQMGERNGHVNSAFEGIHWFGLSATVCRYVLNFIIGDLSLYLAIDIWCDSW